MKRKKEPKVIELIKKSYLAAIKGSVGSKIFKHFYALVDGEEEDVLRNGDLSCAYFVSSILVIFGLIKSTHATVVKTVKDMENSGWKKIKNPKIGSVLVWETKKFEDEVHGHIGFYLGRKKAISNSSKNRAPSIHNWKFNGKRKIVAIYWTNKIKRQANTPKDPRIS